uniref:ATP synthase F0 subunit 8 n=1 Tax=Muusoctopus johnsonianus TaxID=408749 RepID=UPI0022FD64D0|nr:ATP synthase F0 subunit 8 [Muusoctopus johnsonianus]WAP91569.1 ATP synthase F0 subunit 8 [Muusoctopus johnsonianus]
MPQLSPLNWMMLFSMFWILMYFNSSIMWWNNINNYNMNNKQQDTKKINYKW